MKNWEFRNIFYDLNEIEKQILLLTDILPDYVLVRKLADIRMKLLEHHKSYEDSGTLPLVTHDSSSTKQEFKTGLKKEIYG